MNYPLPPCNNGISPQGHLGNAEAMSPEATAAAVAVMAHGLRQQMQMAAVQQHHPDMSNYNISPHLSIHPSSGSSGGGNNNSSRDTKLGSPSHLLSNGNISLSRQNSPNSHHHAALHVMPNVLGGHHSISPEVSPNHLHKSSHDRHNSSSSSSGHHQSTLSTSTSSSSGGAQKSVAVSLTSHNRNASPIERDMDDENSLDSSIEIPHEPSVNLAVGVSGLSYKSSQDFSSPRSDQMFHDDIANMVSSGGRDGGSGVGKESTTGNNEETDDYDECSRTTPRLSNFKEPTIKIEPIVSECRGE